MGHMHSPIISFIWDTNLDPLDIIHMGHTYSLIWHHSYGTRYPPIRLHSYRTHLLTHRTSFIWNTRIHLWYHTYGTRIWTHRTSSIWDTRIHLCDIIHMGHDYPPIRHHSYRAHVLTHLTSFILDTRIHLWYHSYGTRIWTHRTSFMWDTRMHSFDIIHMGHDIHPFDYIRIGHIY